jgi:hypothetical protein
MTTGTFRLGKWRRSTRSGDYRIAEGPLVFGDIEITVSLHCRDLRLYWLTFPKNTCWLNRVSLHWLTQAVVTRLKETQSEIYWASIDRATPEDRADLQGRVRLHLHQGGRP